jgi:hypothetical protein
MFRTAFIGLVCIVGFAHSEEAVAAAPEPVVAAEPVAVPEPVAVAEPVKVEEVVKEAIKENVNVDYSAYI